MAARLQLSGWEETRRRLSLVRTTVGEQTAAKAVREGGRIVLEEMATRAPVLDHKTARSTAQEPGTLKGAIRMVVHGAKEGVAAEALVGPSKKYVFLARWVEYGHRLVKGGYSKITARGRRGPGRDVGVVPAYPFLRPAWEATRGRALEKMAEVYREAIRRVAQ